MWTQRQNIKKVTEHAQKRHTDQLIIEKTSNIFLNDTFVYTGSHSATLEKEWAVGYLLVHDKINLDISSVSYTNNKIHVTASESSIKEQTHAAFLKPIPEIIFQLTSYFQEAAILYKKTAITESAAIADHKQILYNAEDISQENALYKVLGRHALSTEKTESPFLLLSSKIDHLTVKTILKFNFKLLITRTAPTQQALELAKQHHISIVGFARGRKYNWYT